MLLLCELTTTNCDDAVLITFNRSSPKVGKTINLPEELFEDATLINFCLFSDVIVIGGFGVILELLELLATDPEFG